MRLGLWAAMQARQLQHKDFKLCEFICFSNYLTAIISSTPVSTFRTIKAFSFVLQEFLLLTLTGSQSSPVE